MKERSPPVDGNFTPGEGVYRRPDDRGNQIEPSFEKGTTTDKGQLFERVCFGTDLTLSTVSQGRCNQGEPVKISGPDSPSDLKVWLNIS